MMLFISIKHPGQLKEIPDWVDGVELRLDLFPEIDFQQLESLLKASKPLLFCLGSQFKGNRKSLIEQLLSLEPPFFDLDHSLPASFLKKMVSSYPKTEFILSYHNFEETPADLEKIYLEMAQIPAFSYKIAAVSQSTNDALRMLLLTQKHPEVSAICMGECGAFARVLGKIYGNRINFACLDETQSVAPGQLSATELKEIYRFDSLNRKTAVFGLIGDPVINSQGHLYHNRMFEKKQLNAVYVKMCVKPGELATFFTLAKGLAFQGLSVTMPLKEQVLSFLSAIDTKAEQIGAVNTLGLGDGQVSGMNTDGVGALDAIEKRTRVKGKQMVLIGAGGAARAIAFEARWRGANVLIVIRTLNRAKQLAKAVHCQAGTLSDIPPVYDILVNCSPDAGAITEIIPSALVMDIVYVPRETLFLKRAKELGCEVIYGEEMFWNQAAAQAQFWS